MKQLLDFVRTSNSFLFWKVAYLLECCFLTAAASNFRSPPCKDDLRSGSSEWLRRLNRWLGTLQQKKEVGLTNSDQQKKIIENCKVKPNWCSKHKSERCIYCVVCIYLYCFFAYDVLVTPHYYFGGTLHLSYKELGETETIDLNDGKQAR